MSTQDTQPDIQRVFTKFENWRKTRKNRCAIPEELWTDAVELARKYDVTYVARHLRLNTTKLRARLKERLSSLENEAASLVVASEPIQEASDQDISDLGFIEFPAIDLDNRQTEPNGSVIELHGVDGAKVMIQLSASQPVDVVGLAHAFWSRAS